MLFDHLQKLYRDVEWKGDEITIPSIQIKLVPPYYAGWRTNYARERIGRQQEGSRKAEENSR